MNPNETKIPAVDLAGALQMQPIKTNLWSRIQLWHGEPKIGKTVQANLIPGGSFFLKFEPAHEHIAHRGEVCESWPKFLGVARSIAIAKRDGTPELPFSTIVVDTASEAFRRCQEHELRKLGLEHESDADFGKGYSAVENEFRRRMVGLCQLGFGVVMIAHSAEKTFSNGKKGNAKEEHTRVVVDFNKAAGRVVPPMADLILYFCAERGEDNLMHRAIKTRTTNTYQAGVRYPPGWKKTLPETIPMDYAKLVEAWDAGRPDGMPAEPPPPKKEAPPKKPPTPKREEPPKDPPAPKKEATPWLPVTSSNIKAVRHDGDQQMDVEFLKSGDIYRYQGVSNELFAAFIAAESVGGFFAQNIKQLPNFERIRVGQLEPAPPPPPVGAPPPPEEPPHPADTSGPGGSFEEPPDSQRRTGTTLERRPT